MVKRSGCRPFRPRHEQTAQVVSSAQLDTAMCSKCIALRKLEGCMLSTVRVRNGCRSQRVSNLAPMTGEHSKTDAIVCSHCEALWRVQPLNDAARVRTCTSFFVTVALLVTTASARAYTTATVAQRTDIKRLRHTQMNRQTRQVPTLDEPFCSLLWSTRASLRTRTAGHTEVHRQRSAARWTQCVTS